MTTKARVGIRVIIDRDVRDVLWIEEASYQIPWSEEQLRLLLRQRNIIGLVAESGNRIVGFSVYELIDCELFISNLAVHPHFYRHGIGTQFIERLKSKLGGPSRRRKLSMYINERNVEAQLFLRANGFRCVKQVPNLFSDLNEDGYKFSFKAAE